MTEAEWAACADPAPMLAFLGGAASERKLRLFACACCRRIWPLLTDARSRRNVEVVERFADTPGNGDELAVAIAGAEAAEAAASGPGRAAARAAATAWYAADHCASAAARASGRPETERAAQAALLRDLFGNPLRSPPPAGQA